MFASTRPSSSGPAASDGHYGGEPSELTLRGLYHRKRGGAITVVGIVLLAAVLPWWRSDAVSAADVVVGVVLVGLFVVCVAISRAAERWRFSVAGGHTQDLLTSCTLAAALLLPAPVAAAVIVTVYVSDIGTMRELPWFRWAYGTAAVVISAVAASTVVHALPGPHVVGLVVGAATYLVVNPTILASAFLTSGERDKLRRFLSPANWTTELLAAAVGLLLVLGLNYAPYTAVLVLPVMLLLQRYASQAQITEKDAVDPETGELTESAILAVAEQILYGRDEADWTLVRVDLIGVGAGGGPLAARTLTAGLMVDDQLGHFEDGFLLLLHSGPVAARNFVAKREQALARLGYLGRFTLAPTGALDVRLSELRERSARP